MNHSTDATTLFGENTSNTSNKGLNIALDPRVFVEPLTGIARVADTMKIALEQRGHTVQNNPFRLPYRVQNMLWRRSGFRRFATVNKTLNEGTQIFHALWPFAPLPSVKAPVKTIATFHDTIPLNSEWSSEFSSHDRRTFEYDTRDALLRADQCMFVSEFTKRDVLHFYGLADEPSRMHVVSLGVHPFWIESPSQTNTPMPRALQPAAETLQHHKHELSRGFVVAVGSVLPHKNIQQLIDAYDESFPPLIIAGALAHSIELRGKKNIATTGYIEDTVLLWLYDNALCSVFPSLHEGFGLPPLEAMTRHCPVVASSSTSIPEVVGQAALLVDCREPRELQMAIRNVLLSSQLQEELTRAGDRHIQQFTPAAFAQRLEALYAQALRSV